MLLMGVMCGVPVHACKQASKQAHNIPDGTSLLGSEIQWLVLLGSEELSQLLLLELVVYSGNSSNRLAYNATKPSIQ
jgi:hypothetical protein